MRRRRRPFFVSISSLTFFHSTTPFDALSFMCRVLRRLGIGTLASSAAGG
jgi:hypothetical protein